MLVCLALGESFLFTARGVFIPNMSSPNTYSLRIVVQNIRSHQRSVYRLVAYGGDGGNYTSGSAEFESRDQLLRAFRSVVPDFDASSVSVERNALETYIAYAGEMKLDDSQLSLLGLKVGMGS